MIDKLLKPEELFEYGKFFSDEMKDTVTALLLFMVAAIMGNVVALTEIAYIIECKSTSSDPAEKLYRKLEAAGYLSPYGFYRLGMISYWDRTDVEEALRCLKKAAESDCEEAYEALGYIFHNEKHDLVGAEEWYEKAASAQSLWHSYLEDYEDLLESKYS